MSPTGHATVGSEWDNALPAYRWNTLAFEPYASGSANGGPPTVGGETNAAESLIATMRAGPTGTKGRYLMYEAWPPTAVFSASTYDAYWKGSVSAGSSDPFTMQLATMNAVYATLQGLYGSQVYVVPVGDVLDQIDLQARTGQIPGISSVNDLYLDGVHMADIGQFVATCTMFSTLFQRQCNVTNSAQLTPWQSGNGPTLTLAIAQQMQSLVWSVISADPRAIH